jgi:hypothetical protein
MEKVQDGSKTVRILDSEKNDARFIVDRCEASMMQLLSLREDAVKVSVAGFRP